MLKKLRLFCADQDGAVTVDWVVLTAGVVGVNLLIVANIIIDGAEVNATYIDGQVKAAVNDF